MLPYLFLAVPLAWSIAILAAGAMASYRDDAE